MKRRQVIKSVGAAAFVFAPGLNSYAQATGAKTIKIAQSAPLSGPLGPQVQSGNQSAALVFDSVNRNGGINGLPIEYITMDDQFQPSKTLANCEQLIHESRVVALFSLVGSANVMAVQPLLEKTGVPLIAGIGVSDSAREMTRNSAYYVRAGYGREIEKILRQIATLGIRRIALAALDNAGGEEVKAIFVHNLQQLGIAPGATVSVKVDASNISTCAAALAVDRPQAVVLFLGGALPGKLIEALDALGAFPSFYGTSIVPGEITAKALASKLRSLVICQVVPYPWARDVPAIQEFQRVAAGSSVPVGYGNLEAYINALVLVEVLKRAGKDLSPAKLHATARRLKGRFGGLDVDFTGATNTGAKFTELVYLNGAGRLTR
jgi:ABC-type branched-subunit amino acid transport system substrate-binding protein